MSDKEINQLPLGDPITGDEFIISDVESGVSPSEWDSRKHTYNMIKAFLAGKNTFFTPAGAMKPAATNGAESADIELRIGATDEYFNFPVLNFDWLADEFANIWVPFPESWDLGTITFRVVWTTSYEGTNGIAFFARALAVADGEAIASSANGYGTAVGITDDAQSAGSPTSNYEFYISDESAAITINASGSLADLMGTFIQVYRDVSDANDDMAADMSLMGVIWKFNTDTLKDD